MTSAVYEYVASRPNWRRALNDIARGWAQRRLWTDMAVRGFNKQYKGAVVGAFWLTLTTALHAIGWGILHGLLFGGDIATHMPWLVTGIIIWGLITGFVSGGCELFTSNARTFKDFPVPLSLFAYRLALKQIIHTGYRASVMVVVLVLFAPSHLIAAPIALIGFALIVWIGFWVSIPLGVINARYRDFGQMVGAVMQFGFFMTPIIWHSDRVRDYQFVINFNPFYHLIQTVRGPLLGVPGYETSFMVVAGLAVVAPLAAFVFYGRFSHRLPYWC